MSTKPLIKRFAKALSLALYDFECERVRRLQFFHDADVVVSMVLGFLQFKFSVTRAAKNELLARSLLASGLLGKAYILRPHALEIDERLRSQPAYDTPMRRGLFKHDFADFLKKSGIEEATRALSKIIKTNIDEQEKTERLVTTLQEIGPDSFVSIELATGTWQQRLHRLWDKTIVFSPLRLDFGEVLRSESVRSFHAVLSKQRKPSRFATNNLRDAVALALLHDVIALSIQDSSTPHVRFYTETAAIHRVFQESPELRSSISYQSPLIHESRYSDEQVCILRDADYLIMRATFPALAFPESEGILVNSSTVSLAHLKEVSRLLESILDKPVESFEEAIKAIHIDGRPIAAVLKDFEDLSFAQTIWRHYKFPELLRRALTDLGEVLDFLNSQSYSVNNFIRVGLEGIQEELDEKLKIVRLWSDDLQIVRREVYRLHERLKDSKAPDPLRDLGLIRWGVELDESGWRLLDSYLKDILSGEESRMTSIASELALACNDCKGEPYCTVAAAVLGVLGLFSKVTQLIENFSKTVGGNLLLHLELMRAAAKVRQAPARSAHENNKILERLGTICSSLEGESRGKFFIGIAYVSYYCWYSQRRDLSLKVRKRCPKSVLSEWAERSFDFGEKAVESCTPGTLAWAFAVNHCAYVGSVAEVGGDKVRDYLNQLRVLRGYPDLWNYRFADTLAYERYLTAKRRWADVKPHVDDLARREICHLLDSAKEWLRDAVPSFSDPEITIHRDEIDFLAQEVGCISNTP